MRFWSFLALLLIVTFIALFAIALFDVAPAYVIGFGVAVVIGTVPVLIHTSAQNIKKKKLQPAREEQLKSLRPEAVFC